jgi:uncharacterized phiE125 gp8 family phage protein
MTFSQTTAPTTYPVTLQEAKNHLRVDVTDDDALITAQIQAATSWVEQFCGRQLITATYLLTLDRFPRWDTPIILPRPPAISVTSITYTKSDESTDTVTSTDYVLDNKDDLDRHRIVLKDAFSWPTDTRDYAAVRVIYTAGYGAASAVPDVYKSAIKLMVGNLYENRETAVVGTIVANLPTIESLLRNRRVGAFL